MLYNTGVYFNNNILIIFETIFLWLTKSGMVVNELKTCLCVFYKHDCTPLIVDVNGKFLISQKTINVLGVIFDSKLQWAPQIANCVSRSLNALSAIKLIKKLFSKKELFAIIWTQLDLLLSSSDL